MKCAACIVIAALANVANAQVSFIGVNDSYSITWDSLSTTANATWINNVGYPGWYLYTHTGGAISEINLNSGGLNGGNATGSFYSYGSTNSSDRALGGLASGGAYFNSPANGAVAAYIAFSVTNNTGATLSGFNVSFDGEQWRAGANSPAQSMVLEYGFGATFASVSTWTAPGGNFDWTSPVIGGSSGVAVDGNSTGLVAGRGGAISSLNWQDGATLWLRWIENNDTGNDHGLAIDNFRISVPTPGTTALMGVGILAFNRRRR